jgi:HSP20 family protein
MALVPIRKREGDRGALAHLHAEMDDLFRNFFNDWEFPIHGRSRWPALDIAESENEFVVKADVPGCKADDIDISVHGNTLTITGEKKQEEERKEKGYYHMERSYGSFRRDLNLAADIDTEKIQAACKEGVLTITLPKAATSKPVKVKVKGE